MYRLLRLQLVFWLGVIGGIVALLVITIIGDIEYISGFSFLLAITAHGCGWSGISSSCSKTTILQLV